MLLLLENAIKNAKIKMENTKISCAGSYIIFWLINFDRNETNDIYNEFTKIQLLPRNPFIYFYHTIVFTGYTGHQIRVCNRKLLFLFLNQNICCGCSKELSQWHGFFEYPKLMARDCQLRNKNWSNSSWPTNFDGSSV